MARKKSCEIVVVTASRGVSPPAQHFTLSEKGLHDAYKAATNARRNAGVNLKCAGGLLRLYSCSPSSTESGSVCHVEKHFEGINTTSIAGRHAKRKKR